MFRRLLTLLLVSIFPAVAAAQQRPTPEQVKAAMAKTMPGDHHRELALLVGEWTQDVTYYMGTRKPMRSRGTARNRMILGGRFLVSERTSHVSAGEVGDVKVEAMSIYGFDGRTSEYTILELDTMGTYWVSAAGAPPLDNTIVMSGETIDSQSSTRGLKKYDMVLRVVDADTYVTEIIFKFPNRPPTKLVEVVSRRVK